MRSTAMKVRWLFLFGFALALLTAFGCSNGGSVIVNEPALACVDGGAAAANAVVMNCGGATDSTTERVDVVMGGPAAGSTALRGLNFDVTYDPAYLTFVSATENTGGPFSANALLLAKALPNDPTPRVVVSIQQVSGDPDVVIGAGQQVLMLHLTFTRAPGVTTFGATPLNFDVATSEATPPAPPTLPTVVAFGGALGLSYQ